MKKRIVSEYNKDTKKAFSITINKKLVNKQSKYQKIEIYESNKFGNVLLLDGCFMFTEKDHHCYHNKCFDLISQKKNIKNILIIGGGDFGLVKKLSIIDSIKSINLIEIDEMVVDLCKKYFPQFFKIKKEFMKKIKISFKDDYIWVKNTNKKFDLIIVDSTDPVGIAKKLFTKNFYRYIYTALSINGVYIQQSGSPIIHEKKIIQPMVKILNKVKFKNITINPFVMPCYPSGLWSFMKCERKRCR